MKKFFTLCLALVLLSVIVIPVAACGKREPHITSKKITAQSSKSATVSVVVEKRTQDNYNLTITIKVRFSGWRYPASTVTTTTVVFMGNETRNTFTVGATNPEGGSDRRRLQSVTLTYTKVPNPGQVAAET